MIKRRFVSVVLVLCMVLSLGWIGDWKTNATGNLLEGETGDVVVATSTDAYRYFYDQLSDTAKIFYGALYQMYVDDTLKTGTGAFDLSVAENGLTQTQIAAHLSGQGDLLAEFGAGRDAFYQDYPSVFYVDFSNLTFRVTMDAEGMYHAYIGAGRTDTYYTQGFTNQEEVDTAVAEYNTALQILVENAKVVEPRVGQSYEAAQVEYVHDALTNSISYRLEDVCAPENRGFVRTSYGALVKHEGVCEAYTRAFKAAMDELGIPCVMVNGVYLHNANTPEVHIWNYVQLDGKWYGVDATMDDPYPPSGKQPVTTTGQDGYENHEYLLRGDLLMGQKHVPIGIISTANYEFTYPTLDINDYGVEIITRDNGFSVSFKQDGVTDDGEDAAGEFYISYKDMGCAAAREAGYWFLERFWTRDEDGNLMPDDWHYILTDVYNLDDHETYLHLSYAQVEFVEFAVTEVAPGPYLEDPYTYMWYVGELGGIGPQSGMIYNANSGYKAPPYPKKVTPEQNVRMYIQGTTYHIEIEYNDDLMLESTNASVGVKLECSQYKGIELVDHPSGVANSKIENIVWDGARNISFDFTPSEMYADDSVFYVMYITGLVGVSSGKAPVEISYGAAHKTSFCALRADGFNWHIFGQPSLIDNSDLSTSGWVMRDGSSVSDLLASRLTLVASSTSPAQTEVMNSLIEGTGDSLLSSQTYNITLSLCKGCLSHLADGQAIRLALGFPEGYGPDDEGVTFKAYHFIKDAADNTIGVEEIPCIITRYGLIIECYSFSPFAVAAVETTEENTDKTLILTSDIGGSVTCEEGTDQNGIITLKKGQSVTVTVNADDGYIIDTLVAADQYVTIIDDKTMTVTVSYDDLTGISGVVSASFLVASAIEDQVGETVAPSAVEPDTVEVDANVKRINDGESLTITAVIAPENSNHIYQWYKDGVALTGQTDKNLEIDHVTLDDSGAYTLKVSTVVGPTVAVKESEVCIVTVISAESSEDGTTEEPSTDEPTVDDATSEESSTDEPITDNPTTDEPSTDEPITDNPTTSTPSIDAPSTDDPTSDAPSTGDVSGTSGNGSAGTGNQTEGVAQNSPVGSDTPKTGDNSNLMMVWFMMLISECGVITTMVHKIKRKRI